MKISTGQRLGTFEVSAVLGEGGMGEVWRATDERLGREVALKVLPEDFADDPNRHARFEREAKVLGSLNHPNIATLYGLEHLEGQHVLVMELVEGEGLDEVIARGAIQSDEALSMALQIAEALEAAHEAGIVHRDLKPANIRIRPDGTVKVLDFGLAKEWEADSGDSSLSFSPTMTKHATAAGVILGTAAYMAPEQARGKPVDKRADIWAFGVVLWEMLTGRKIFDGDTVTDVIAAVVTRDPDWDALPKDLSPVAGHILRRCLERDRKRRFRDIGDVRIELEGADEDGSSPLFASDREDHPTLLTWSLPWLLLLVMTAAAIPLAMHRLRGSPPGPAVQTAVLPAQDTALTPESGLALSPDGRMLAFVAGDGNVDRLWIRRLENLSPQPLTGTEGARYPFWSPDGLHIAYFAGGKLKRIPAVGGAERILADAPEPRGGCWLQGGEIVFAPDYRSGLRIVPSGGGDVLLLTELDVQRVEKSHRWPVALPGGEHVLFLSQTAEGGTADDRSGLDVLSMADRSRTRIIDVNSSAAFASPGYLLYWNEGSLVSHTFDPRKLMVTGEPTPVAEGVGYTANEMGIFSVSQTGNLVFHQGSGVHLPSRLEWYDREGELLSEAAPVGLYRRIRLAPDGRRVAYTEGLTVWVRDLDRGTNTRVTFEEKDHVGPAWSPDGEWLTYITTMTTGSEIRRKSASGLGAEELVYEFERIFEQRDWSSDGQWLVFETLQAGTEWDIWLYSFAEDEARPLIETPFSDFDPAFSPDARHVIYESNESGRMEVYVVPVSGERRKWQVSTAGGSRPVWSPVGDEIFFVDLNGDLTTVSVTGIDDLEFGEPQKLFRLSPRRFEDETYDVTPDGRRILVNSTEAQPNSESLILFQNWEELMEVD